MATKTTEPLLPAWEDRWNEPTFEALMAPQKEQHLNLLHNLLERTHAFTGVSRSLVWYGDSWKWTIQYVVDPEAADATEPLAYFVPNPEQPVFCVPLREEMIAAMPTKRLNRYIRDGIRGGKCAVDIHWVMWTPTAMTEVEHLVDLIKRKHKFLTVTAKK